MFKFFQTIPADLLIMKTAAKNGFCYMQTTNLDGESNLKPREAVHVFTTELIEDKDYSRVKGFIDIDQPNSNLYAAQGTLWIQGYERNFFNIDNILLRVNKWLMEGNNVEECRLGCRVGCLYRERY